MKNLINSESQAAIKTETLQESEAVSKGESEMVPRAENETVSREESETVSQEESETVPQAENKTVSQEESEAVSQTESETVPQAESETISQAESETVPQAESGETPQAGARPSVGVLGLPSWDSIPAAGKISGGVVLALLIAAAVALFFRKGRKRQEDQEPESKESMNDRQEDCQVSPVEGSQRKTMGNEIPAKSSWKGKVGKIHNIGKRSGQQDSFGTQELGYGNGLFAVVADGMGGLAEGDKVSQKIVMTMLEDAARVTENRQDSVLFEMVSRANTEVNKMLNVSSIGKSGSTLIAVLAETDGFYWVSVGDSRIYLYRDGELIQLNREHTYKAELLVKAVNGEVSFEQAKTHKKQRGLTSFIGMGNLKYIDGSYTKIPSKKNDALLLMSDGVFNTITEKEMCWILDQAVSPETAAAKIEERILFYDQPQQDNFTAVIIGL